MSVFIVQYMQIRAYIKRILRYSYWCKNAEISYYDEESLLKRWNRNRLMKHSSAVTCFFLQFSLFPWCPVEYWYSFGKLGHQIIKLCIESINTLKINTIFAARIPCLLSTLLRNGDMWIYKSFAMTPIRTTIRGNSMKNITLIFVIWFIAFCSFVFN